MEKRIHSIVAYLFIALIFIIPLVFSTSPLLSFSFAKFIPFFVVIFAGLLFRQDIQAIINLIKKQGSTPDPSPAATSTEN